MKKMSKKTITYINNEESRKRIAKNIDEAFRIIQTDPGAMDRLYKLFHTKKYTFKDKENITPKAEIVNGIFLTHNTNVKLEGNLFLLDLVGSAIRCGDSYLKYILNDFRLMNYEEKVDTVRLNYKDSKNIELIIDVKFSERKYYEN
jgi:hypothetical protein